MYRGPRSNVAQGGPALNEEGEISKMPLNYYAYKIANHYSLDLLHGWPRLGGRSRPACCGRKMGTQKSSLNQESYFFEHYYFD